jgi:hypothetical protein
MVLYKSGKTVVCEASHTDIKVLVKWWKEKIFLSFFCKVQGKLLQKLLISGWASWGYGKFYKST